MTSQGSGTSEGKFGLLKSFRQKLPEVKLANIAGVMFTVGGVVIMTVTNSMTDSALKMLSAKVSEAFEKTFGKKGTLVPVPADPGPLAAQNERSDASARWFYALSERTAVEANKAQEAANQAQAAADQAQVFADQAQASAKEAKGGSSS
ncbi:hypothetical protein OROGR_015532 [Orobanche gracilis]